MTARSETREMEMMALDSPKTPNNAVAENIPASGQVQPEIKKQRTTGNKIFDWLVYPSIAFGAVLIASVAVLDFSLKRKGSIRDFQQDFSQKVAGWLKSAPFHGTLDEKQLDGRAKNYVMIGASFAAGTLLMAPIKWLEDARGKISGFFDRGLKTEPTDQSKVAQEPKQSWKSVLGGRAITFASVLAIGTALGDKYTKLVTHTVADWGVGAAKLLKPDLTRKQLATGQRYARFAAFEGFYTAICATLVYTISRTLARSFGKKETATTDGAFVEALPAAENTATRSAAESSLTGKEPVNEKRYASTEQKASHLAALHQSRTQATEAGWAKA